MSLRDERLKRGMTLQDVGEIFGVSKQFICNIEKGKRYPSYKLLSQMEEYFGIPHQELVPVSP